MLSFLKEVYHFQVSQRSFLPTLACSPRDFSCLTHSVNFSDSLGGRELATMINQTNLFRINTLGKIAT